MSSFNFGAAGYAGDPESRFFMEEVERRRSGQDDVPSTADDLMDMVDDGVEVMPERDMEVGGSAPAATGDGVIDTAAGARNKANEDAARRAGRRSRRPQGEGSTSDPSGQLTQREMLRAAEEKGQQKRRDQMLTGRGQDRSSFILGLLQMYGNGMISRRDVRDAFKVSGMSRRLDKNALGEGFGGAGGQARRQGAFRQRMADRLENMYGVDAGDMGISEMRQRMKEENIRKMNREKRGRGPGVNYRDPTTGALIGRDSAGRAVSDPTDFVAADKQARDELKQERARLNLLKTQRERQRLEQQMQQEGMSAPMNPSPGPMMS